MELLYITCIFITGLFLGSFFCCLGERLGREEEFIKSRSHCNFCTHNLNWYDLIPVISYLSLKGKCRYCKKKISPLSTFIEITTGLLYVISYYSFGFSLDFLLSIIIISMAMVIFASDLTCLIIPDEVLIVVSILLLIIKFIMGGGRCVFVSLINGGILFLFMLMLMKLGDSLFKKESLGGGDVKLLFVLGLVMEILPTFVSILLASIIALPVSLYLLVKNKEHVIPFGPFLLIGFLIIYFMKITTTDILNLFYL